MSQDPASASAAQEPVTPDHLLHTGSSDDPSPEDLVLASGRDMTPENLEWARRTIEAEGRSALDKRLP
ncbi:hypothetical protein [uncultured Streptomyces sp.]|uniref:hypothetical protein n=1 Tax=uncultured Streptomyces sp. TaxID=174707 RepID=UPI00262B5E37|nr:hypothetical protein [uncultured Streptomyces sp.]